VSAPTCTANRFSTVQYRCIFVLLFGRYSLGSLGIRKLFLALLSLLLKLPFVVGRRVCALSTIRLFGCVMSGVRLLCTRLDADFSTVHSVCYCLGRDISLLFKLY